MEGVEIRGARLALLLVLVEVGRLGGRAHPPALPPLDLRLPRRRVDIVRVQVEHGVRLPVDPWLATFLHTS